MTAIFISDHARKQNKKRLGWKTHTLIREAFNALENPIGKDSRGATKAVRNGVMFIFNDAPNGKVLTTVYRIAK